MKLAFADGTTPAYTLSDTADISTGGVLTVAKSVNNATPSIGDVLTFPLGTSIRVVRVLALGQRRGPARGRQP